MAWKVRKEGNYKKMDTVFWLEENASEVRLYASWEDGANKQLVLRLRDGRMEREPMHVPTAENLGIITNKRRIVLCE